MRILVAFDGSESSLAAIDDLARAGLPSSGTALVLSVLDAWLPPAGDRADEALPSMKELRESVDSSVEMCRESAQTGADRLSKLLPGWSITADACADTPAWAIIRRAEGLEGGVAGQAADLVVLGSRGHGAVKRALLGSVAQKVMHNLRRPLRICREPKPDRTGGIRIVVGVDGSEHAAEAVRTVASRSWPVGTEVLVAAFAQGVAGIEHSNVIGPTGSVWTVDPAARADTGPGGSWASNTAANAASIIRAQCPSAAVSTVVRLGNPNYGLIDEAATWGEHGADCIFVGASGVRGIERLLLGSVSTHVALNASCCVEIVHPLSPAPA